MSLAGEPSGGRCTCLLSHIYFTREVNVAYPLKPADV